MTIQNPSDKSKLRIFLVKHSRDVAFIAGVVYFCQGALGIAGITLPLYLRGLGWSVSEITVLSSIAAFPWVFKILYGLISDSFPVFGYRRKSYLFLLSGIAALGWYALSAVPGEKSWILGCMLITNLGFAATDVITDGLIVEHSTKITSPIYQGIAWGSRSFGALISGVTGGWLAAHWRPQDVFLATISLPALVMIAALLIREKKRERGPFKDMVAPFQQCFRILLTENMRWFILILITAGVAATFGVPFFFYLKEELDFHETFLGMLSSLGWGGALAGSLAYVKLLRHVPPKKLLFGAVLMNSINILSALFIFDEKSALILIFIGGIMGCLMLLPMMTAAAVLTHHSGVEGTLFAVLMSVYNLAQISFGYLGGKIYPFVGLRPMILTTGLAALLGLFFVSRLHFEQIPERS